MSHAHPDNIVIGAGFTFNLTAHYFPYVLYVYTIYISVVLPSYFSF